MQTNTDDGIWMIRNCLGNFGKFIFQFQPKAKRLIRKLERILIELYKKKKSPPVSIVHRSQ